MSSYVYGHVSLDRELFSLASQDCKKVCDSLGGLANWDGYGEPVFSDNQIIFNGKGDQIGNTFCIRSDGGGSQSCNTENKDYDLAVRCCLFIVSYYFRDVFPLNKFTWTDVSKITREILGYPGVI